MVEGTPEINAAFEPVQVPTPQRFTPQEVTERFTAPLLETNRALQADLAAVRKQLPETKQRIRALGGQTSPDRAAIPSASRPSPSTTSPSRPAPNTWKRPRDPFEEHRDLIKLLSKRVRSLPDRPRSMTPSSPSPPPSPPRLIPLFKTSATEERRPPPSQSIKSLERFGFKLDSIKAKTRPSAPTASTSAQILDDPVATKEARMQARRKLAAENLRKFGFTPTDETLPNPYLPRSPSRNVQATLPDNGHREEEEQIEGSDRSEQNEVESERVASEIEEEEEPSEAEPEEEEEEEEEEEAEEEEEEEKLEPPYDSAAESDYDEDWDNPKPGYEMKPKGMSEEDFDKWMEEVAREQEDDPFEKWSDLIGSSYRSSYY